MILKQLPKQFGIKNYLQNSKKPSKMGHLRLVSPKCTKKESLESRKFKALTQKTNAEDGT